MQFKVSSVRLAKILFSNLLLSISIGAAHAEDFHVGPGQALETLDEIDWSGLEAGDRVYIHYAEYREKFNISSRGTAEAPIQIIGIPNSQGQRPVINGDGAVTASDSGYRWQDTSGPSAIQHLGLIHISPRNNGPLPGYIEIKNLEIKNAYVDSSFTGEDGSSAIYDGFASGIYVRTAQNVLIENCIIHSNGQGVYSWTGGGGTNWWDGEIENLTVRGNYFYNNGHTNSWTEHQAYTEGHRTIYEYNHFGPNRSGAWGSQLKDRGSGTVIRYNYFSHFPGGWVIDLVEPENGYGYIFSSEAYKHVFVYGNLFVNNNGNYEPNFVHWNEDHQVGVGRATLDGGKLHFYNNTVVHIGDEADYGYGGDFHYFNTTFGAYECQSGGTRPGVIELRNNIFAAIPRTASGSMPNAKLAYCDDTNFSLGTNLITAGWATSTNGSVTGIENMISIDEVSDFGFVDVGARNFKVTGESFAKNRGMPLANDVNANSNPIQMDLNPSLEIIWSSTFLTTQDRTDLVNGVFNTLGAFAAPTGDEVVLAPPSMPSNVRVIISN